MREYDRAVGQLVVCCSAPNASDRGVRNQRGQQIIEVEVDETTGSEDEPGESYGRAFQ